MKLKGILLKDGRIETTHITEDKLGVNTILEIHTLNTDNNFPEFITRTEILDIIYKD